MSAVLSAASPAAEVVRFAGSKARNLHALERARLSIPPWTAIGSDAFDRFQAETGIREEIAAALTSLSVEGAADAARRVEDIVLGAPRPPGSEEVLRAAYDAVGGGPVAVRSSGGEEDGSRYSFAGQFATILNVSGLDEVSRAVRRCWASAWSERALAYRLRHGLPLDQVEMAVVIQRMVPADKAGVLMTANPLNGHVDELVVSAVYGLGEGLVSGAVDADTLVLDRQTGVVKHATTGDKSERYDADASNGCVTTAVPAGLRGELALDDRELAELAQAAETIEGLFGAPQDVEWAFSDGRLWILQSRPITATAAPPDAGRRPAAEREPGGELRVWDNSNIIESFGGVTAPLTFTFARHVYGGVYREYARLLGVPRADLERVDWFTNMLGYVNGRVYYNLLNWYRMLRLLPLYRLHKAAMEHSMGVGEPLDERLAAKLRALPHLRRRQEALFRVRAAARFARYFVTIEREVERFMDDFYAAYEHFDKIDYDELSAEDAYAHFRQLERELLSRWGHMVLLEQVIGLSYGLLRALTERWLPDAPAWYQFEMVRPTGDVESVDAARGLEELAERARGDAEIEAIVRDEASGAARGALLAAGHADFVAAADEYVERFGYRSANELKLEEPNLRGDPAALFDQLRDALASQRLPAADSTASRDAADKFLETNLHGWRRLVYDLLRRKVRRALGLREQVRFCRTRAFGMTRRIFVGIGRDLERMGLLDAHTDVFFLRLEELRGCFDTTIAHDELREIVKTRRAGRARHERLPAPARFETQGIVYWRGNLESAGWSESAGEPSDTSATLELSGIPSCPGTAEGPASVLVEPRDVDGGIMVAYRTDPGWTSVLPSAAGLVIERGSPLTHVAIVARELGIPTVVQVDGVTRRVRDGTRLRVDGEAGTVQSLEALEHA